MKKTHIFALALAVFVAMGATAAASVYLTKQSLQEPEDKPVAVTETKKKVVKPKRNDDDIVWNNPQPAPAQQPQPVQVASNCDDRNIVGTIVGGAAGALLGSQIGDGGGQTAAVIGGTLGGAYLGNNYIPTRNATCR